MVSCVQVFVEVRVLLWQPVDHLWLLVEERLVWKISLHVSVVINLIFDFAFSLSPFLPLPLRGL